ncbi:Importin-13 [Balamuthia mandrillaris]
MEGTPLQPPPTLEHVQQALVAFYGGSAEDPNKRKQAHEWLLKLQRAPEAWELSFFLLDHQYATEVQLFGAMTLFQKVQKQWPQLPEHARSTFLQSLMRGICSYASGQQQHKPIFAKLCQCFVGTALRMVPAGQWPSFLADLLSLTAPCFMAAQGEEENGHQAIALSPHLVTDNERFSALQAFLEIVKLLPEEIQSSSTLTTQETTAMNATLGKELPHLLRVLGSLLDLSAHHYGGDESDTASTTRVAVLTEQSMACLSSWFSYGISVSEVLESNLLPKTFLALSRMQAARDLKTQVALKRGIEALNGALSLPSLSKYPSALGLFTEGLVSLQSIYMVAVEQEDEDICRSFCELLVTFGENFTSYLLTCGSHGLTLLEMLLLCLEHPNFEVAQQTLSFWYDLEEAVRDASEQNVKQTFAPFFVQLTKVLLSRVVIPADRSLDNDERTAFYNFRGEAADTLLCIHYLLDEQMLAVIVALLEDQVAAAASSVGTKEKEKNEHGMAISAYLAAIEASLFGICSIAENVAASESCYLPKLFSLLFVLPLHFSRFLSETVIRLIGNYEEWLQEVGRHNNELLERSVGLLVNAVNDAFLSELALVSLNRVCSLCASSLHGLLPQMLLAYQKAFSALTTKAKCAFVEALLHIVNTLPSTEAVKHLENILAPIYQQLKSAVQSFSSDVSSTASLVDSLSIGAAFCRTFTTSTTIETSHFLCSSPSSSSPLLLPVSSLLPLLYQCIDSLHKHQKQTSNSLHSEHLESVAEAVCQMLKAAMLSLRCHLAPFLPSLLPLILSWFQQQPQPAYLSLLGTAATAFMDGTEEERRSVAMCFSEAALSTFALLQRDFYGHPLLVQTLFGDVAPRHIQHYVQFLSPELMDGIFVAAMASLTFKEPPAARSAFSILATILSEDRFPALTAHRTDLLSRHCGSLVRVLLQCIGGELPRSMMPQVSKLLFALINADPQAARHWMDQLMFKEATSSTFPSAAVTAEKKSRFLRAVMSTKNRKRFQELVHNFATECRALANFTATFNNSC